MDERPKDMVKLSATTKTKTNLNSTLTFSKYLWVKIWSRRVRILVADDLATRWVPVIGFAGLKRKVFLSCVNLYVLLRPQCFTTYHTTNDVLAKDEQHS